MQHNPAHIVIYGRGTRRLTLTQPPGYRTGADIAPAGPTYAERLATATLGNSRTDLARQLARRGIQAPIPTPKAQKVQAKKIRQVLEHHAGNS